MRLACSVCTICEPAGCTVLICTFAKSVTRRARSLAWARTGNRIAAGSSRASNDSTAGRNGFTAEILRCGGGGLRGGPDRRPPAAVIPLVALTKLIAVGQTAGQNPEKKSSRASEPLGPRSHGWYTASLLGVLAPDSGGRFVKYFFFHLMPWPYLPDDFDQKYDSAWVWLPNSLYDPVKGHDLYQRYIDILAYATIW